MASYLTRLVETNSNNLQPIATTQADPVTVAGEDVNLTINSTDDNPIRAKTSHIKQANDAKKLNSDISNQPDNRSEETNNSVKQERANIYNTQMLNNKSKNESENLELNVVNANNSDVAETVATVNKYNAATSRANKSYAELIDSKFAENDNLKLASTNKPQINPIIIRENDLNFGDNPLLPTPTYSESVEEHTDKNNVVMHNYLENPVMQHIHRQDQTARWDLNEEVDPVHRASKQSIQVNVNINHLEMRKLSSAPVNSRINKQPHTTVNKLSLKDYLKRRRNG